MVFTTNSQPTDLAGVPISSIYRKEDNTFPALASEPGSYQDAFSNPSSAAVMSFLRPLIVQKKSAVTGSGAKTLTCTFDNPTQPGNSIIVVMGMGEVEGAGIVLVITDSQSNTYAQPTKSTQSTTLEAAIFLSVGPASGGGIVGGNDTITATISGGSSSNTAIAMEIYEVWGVISFAGALDQTATGNNAGSTSVSTGAITPVLPNELFFMAISASGGTITAGTNWSLDSGTLAPTGGNLVSFGAQTRAHSTIAALTPAATLGTSNAWAACCATFKSISVPVQGIVTANAGANLNTSLLALESGGNLATLAGVVSGGKAATKAAAGDLVDLATLLALAGTSGDANTVNSLMGRLTKIRDLLNATLTVSLPSNAAQETGGNLATLAGAVRAEDSASADAQTGIGLLAVRKATPGNTSTTDGDYEFLQISGGRLWVDASGVTLTVSGTVTANAGSGTFNIQTNAAINNAQVSGTAIDVNSGNKSAGTQRVVLATDQPALTNAQPTYTTAQVSGGATPYHLVSAASTNATNVKASAAKLEGYTISNTNASALFVKFYDTAGTPTAGSGTIKHTVQIPGNSVVARTFKDGVDYPTGLAFVTVTTIADTGSTGVGANDLSIDLDYK